jgi:short-subunit dehydrogenase
MAVYYATKAYVLSLSEALAEEVRGTGVTVTALCPGPTATGFADTAAMSRSRLFRLARPAESIDVARAGYRAMLRGKPILVTGAANKLLAQSVRIAPRALVRKIARALQENG